MHPLEPLRWGILGCGNIARSFAAGLRHAPQATLAAVGSRDRAKAEAFAAELGAARAHGSYESLAADPDVDIVYVATPHPLHCENTLLAIREGKHVLCEKPFAVTAAEARRMVDAARARKVFLMEGMWTRFFPLMGALRQLLHAGRIGEPRMLRADFGFRGAWDPEGRLLNAHLAGGALLDVGIYPVSLAYMLFGKPDFTAGAAAIGETGVDEQSAAIFRHAGGRLSLLCMAVRTRIDQETMIFGTEGCIRILRPCWHPASMIVTSGGNEERLDFPYEGNGYQFEAIEAAQCIARGDLESAVLPLAESIAIMETLDTLRQHWGLRYPFE
jgi:dihydrodiol dehydrogenase / D-xylose 1-dehydrogenase (NADP)